jgi:hypothetical protein
MEQKEAEMTAATVKLDIERKEMEAFMQGKALEELLLEEELSE